MRFKEYYLLRENPDKVQFVIDKNKVPEFKEYGMDRYLRKINTGEVYTIRFHSELLEPFTFYMINDFIVYNRSDLSYHTGLATTLMRAIESAEDDKNPTQYCKRIIEKREKLFGNFTDKDYLFLKELGEETSYEPDNFKSLVKDNYTREVVSGRIWKLTPEIALVSTWNSWNNEWFKLSNSQKDLLNRFISNVYPHSDSSKTLYDVNSTTKEILFLNSNNFNQISIPQKEIPNKEKEIPIHELPPERKKSALLQKGAKPKIPKDFSQRREGD